MRLRRALLAGAVFSLLLVVPAGARIDSSASRTDATIGELQRLAPSNGRSRPMPDRAGEPRGSGVPIPRGAPRTIGARIVAAGVVPPAKRNNRLNWHGFPTKLMPAVGRIWGSFRGSSALYPLCSGTVVARGIVVTAGHCLVDTDRVDGNGEHPYLSRIIFVPGQTWNNPQSSAADDIKAPWGVWEARDWWVPASYKKRTSQLDWGLIQIDQRSDGTFVGDVTGSWPMQAGIRFNGGARIYSVGYPGSGDWSTPRLFVGRGQYACDTTWAAGAWLSASGGYELWIRCPMNGGASGGPWFVQLANGSWVIGGVNNQCNDDNEGDDWSAEAYCTPVSTELRSLVFDNRFLQFWNSVLPLLHG